MDEKNSAIVTGSFDPITVGHLDIIKRSSELYSPVYVVMFINPDKTYALPVQKRLSILKKACEGLQNVRVDFSDGLVVDYMKKNGIHTIIRGIRNETDAAYENKMAEANKKLWDSAETVILKADEKYAFISSTLVRDEIEKYGHSEYCPWYN